jgi:hypothetical protein
MPARIFPYLSLIWHKKCFYLNTSLSFAQNAHFYLARIKQEGYHMKATYLQQFLTAFLLTTGLTILSTPAHATTDEQACNLGSPCSISDQLDRQTIINVSKSNGIHYSCKIHTDNDSLKVYVTDGGDFDIKKGSGYYNANPDVTVDIIGVFDGDQGQIKINRISGKTGSVTCSSVK